MHGTSAPVDLFSSRNGVLPVLRKNGSKVSSEAVLVLSFLEPISFFCAPPRNLPVPLSLLFQTIPPSPCLYMSYFSPWFEWISLELSYCIISLYLALRLHGETRPLCSTVNCIWVFLVIFALFFCYFCQTSDRVPSQSPLRISSSWCPRVILFLWQIILEQVKSLTDRTYTGTWGWWMDFMSMCSQ